MGEDGAAIVKVRRHGQGGNGGLRVPTGPKDAKSTTLTIEEEAIIVAFHGPSGKKPVARLGNPAGCT